MRSGAFNDKEALEPMSAFKWRRLFQMVEAQRVVSVFAHGAYNNGYDESLNIPEELLKVIGSRHRDNLMPKDTFLAKRPKLRNMILNRKLKKIKAVEGAGLHFHEVLKIFGGGRRSQRIGVASLEEGEAGKDERSCHRDQRALRPPRAVRKCRDLSALFSDPVDS